MMNNKRIIVENMKPRERIRWTGNTKLRRTDKRLLRNTAIFAAVSLCAGMGAWLAIGKPQAAQMVMSRVKAGFEYDDTLGRLQFVSNLLPETAMVFLSGEDAQTCGVVAQDAAMIHAWTEEEPWLEYACTGEISACQDGEVMTVVKNRDDAYTVRVMHKHGYESVYSGLKNLKLREHDPVQRGQTIGIAAGKAAFELRRDGLSVLPVFGESN